jgi:hypothetical protein
MKNLNKSTFFLLILCTIISCSSSNKSEKIIEDDKLKSNCNTPCKVKAEPYEIDFKLNQTKDKSYSLAVSLMLNNGSYLMSNESKNQKGHFRINYSENDFIFANDHLLEEPKSKKEQNVWGPDTVQVIRENTIIKQQIFLKSDEDFEVSGYVQFVIEPKCTMEMIPFNLEKSNGGFRVYKI